jgi:hypothetical protein
MMGFDDSWGVPSRVLAPILLSMSGCADAGGGTADQTAQARIAAGSARDNGQAVMECSHCAPEPLASRADAVPPYYRECGVREADARPAAGGGFLASLPADPGEAMRAATCLAASAPPEADLLIRRHAEMLRARGRAAEAHRFDMLALRARVEAVRRYSASGDAPGAEHVRYLEAGVRDLAESIQRQAAGDHIRIARDDAAYLAAMRDYSFPRESER